MDWNAIGAVGEIVGAVAVVATLFYLSRQISHNNVQLDVQSRLLRTGIFDAIDKAFRDFRAPIIASDEVAQLWDKAKGNFSNLTGSEKTRADNILFEYFVLYRNMFIRMHEIKWEFVDQFEQIDWYRKSMADELRCAGTRDWWKQNNSRLELLKDYVVMINKLIAEFEN